MENISWLFYKDYFRDVSFKEDKQSKENDKKLLRLKNANITNVRLVHKIDIPFEGQRISAQIQYPGLVTGIGINHEAAIEGEFKLGMHFDYTYGLPVIYGSSVKGLLRSAFPESEETGQKGNQSKLREVKTALIREYLGAGFKTLDVDRLRDSIFEGIKNRNGDNREYFSVYDRDIFFDAVIVKPNTKDRILDSDSITPHKKPLQNPIPITFLKIASGCTMEFRFDLKPVTINGIKVTTEHKLALFKQILLDFGIGAKTNVGYGRLNG